MGSTFQCQCQTLHHTFHYNQVFSTIFCFFLLQVEYIVTTLTWALCSLAGDHYWSLDPAAK